MDTLIQICSNFTFFTFNLKQEKQPGKYCLGKTNAEFWKF